MFSVHNVPTEGQFISPEKAAMGYAAEQKLHNEYNTIAPKPRDPASSEMLCIDSAVRMEGRGKTLFTWCKGRQRGEEPVAMGATGGEWQGATSPVICAIGNPTYLPVSGSSLI